MPTRSTQTGTRGKQTKCGKNPTKSPYECLKAGIALGKNIGTTQGERQRAELTRRHVAEKRAVEATTKAMTQKDIMGKINTSGLSSLKAGLKIDTLNNRELGGIATRLHGTNQAIPNYWRLSKPALVQALRQRGFR